MLHRPVSGGVGWIAGQLSESAAAVKVSLIEQDLLRYVPAAELFFPAIADDDLPSPLHPLAAYVFAVASLPAGDSLRLERSRFVDKILRTGRVPAIITDLDLTRSLRVRVKAIAPEVGQRAMLLTGDWAGIEGRICEVKRNGIVVVFIELRSVSTVIAAPTHEIQLL